MPLIAIDVTLNTQQFKEEIKNELLWYDPVDKVMHRFSGAKLAYEYVEFPGVEVFVKGMGWIQGKTIAKPEKMYRNSSKLVNNADAILQWARQHSDDLGINAEYWDNREVVVSCAEDKLEEVVNSLYRHRFRYEIFDEEDAKS